jgi:Flp pilus assembly protein TadG
LFRHRFFRTRRHGQALPEFALILPILALIFLSILQVAFILAAQIGITNAVREAARLAATTTPTSTGLQATTNGNGVLAALKDPTNGFLKKNVMAYSSANLVTSGSPMTEVCYTSTTDPATKDIVVVTVEAYYRHPLFIPIVGAILDGIDGTPNDGFRVGSSEQMRVENDELLGPAGVSQCSS